jgi:diguanylate cyclase (GGDEF)-like protein
MASERARMEVMLHRDPLTGIHNRRLGERLLRELLGGAHAAGVIMLDVDRFKAINDTHGHPVGDRVLQAIAERCKALLRADESISRWGGEEFLVIVPTRPACAWWRTACRWRSPTCRWRRCARSPPRSAPP